MGYAVSGLVDRGVVARGLVSGNGEAGAPGWDLGTVSGRLVELGDSGATSTVSAAAALIYEAQQRGEPAAWIGSGKSVFFPPDLAARGIDLAALPVVQVADWRQGARAADTLLRSGGFAVVIFDLGRKGDVPLAVQTRLAGLAQHHRTALVCLTRTQRQGRSLGPLVSLRGVCDKERAGFDRFVWELHVTKDKQRPAEWRHREVCHGPGGLC